MQRLCRNRNNLRNYMTIPEYDADGHEEKPVKKKVKFDFPIGNTSGDVSIPDVKCNQSKPIGEIQKFTCWSCGTEFSFFAMDYNQCPKCKAITRLDEMAFICPNEISVYLHADRHLPKATQDALKELIRCALKLLKTTQTP